MLIDITRMLGLHLEGHIPTGLSRVGLAYIRQYRGQSRALVRFAGRWMKLDDAGSQRIFDALLESDFAVASRLRAAIAWAWVASGRLQSGAGLLNLDYTGLELPAHAAWIRRRGFRSVFFLHDLLPLEHPAYFRPGEEARHRIRLRSIIDAGLGVVVNSHATLAAFESFAAVDGAMFPEAIVAPIAPAPLPEPASQAPLTRAYFVVLGTIEPRKNHLLLLHLWRDIVAQLGDKSPRLVIIGQRGWECEQVVDILERSRALRGFVIEQSHCTDAELSTWLHHAQALLFPSFAEGYGLPLLEAANAGLPIIASDLPVFREVIGDIPEYLDPLDAPRWRELILNYANPQSARRLAQRERLRHFQPPTWDSHFEKVDALMEKVGLCKE